MRRLLWSDTREKRQGKILVVAAMAVRHLTLTCATAGCCEHHGRISPIMCQSAAGDSFVSKQAGVSGLSISLADLKLRRSTWQQTRGHGDGGQLEREAVSMAERGMESSFEEQWSSGRPLYSSANPTFSAAAQGTDTEEEDVRAWTAAMSQEAFRIKPLVVPTSGGQFPWTTSATMDKSFPTRRIFETAMQGSAQDPQLLSDFAVFTCRAMGDFDRAEELFDDALGVSSSSCAHADSSMLASHAHFLWQCDQ